MIITIDHLWIAFGLLGQALFFTRFLVQWIASERVGRSIIPIAFWFFSMGGGLIVLIYSIYRGDPVFIIGNSVGVIVYSRNLFLIFRERAEGKTADMLDPEDRATR